MEFVRTGIQWDAVAEVAFPAVLKQHRVARPEDLALGAGRDLAAEKPPVAEPRLAEAVHVLGSGETGGNADPVIDRDGRRGLRRGWLPSRRGRRLPAAEYQQRRREQNGCRPESGQQPDPLPE